jgi:hypothetical protein
MSRAFVKETDNDPVGFPDRPISPHRNLVTEAGLAAIEAALQRFEATRRDAEEKGDREAADAALREVRYWKARRASAEVVKPSKDKSKASFGMTVILRREDGRKELQDCRRRRGRPLEWHGLLCLAIGSRRAYAWRRRYSYHRRQRGRSSGRTLSGVLPIKSAEP